MAIFMLPEIAPETIQETKSALRPSHLPKMELHCPTDIDEVFEHLADGYELLAGGSDILLSASHCGKPSRLVWTGGIETMKEFNPDANPMRIGAAVPLARMIRSQVFRAGAPAVAEGAQSVGSVQLRNQATMVGNICTASPAADTVPGLLIHGCVVETANRRNERRQVELKDFVIGPGKTALGWGELVTGLSICRLAKNEASAYQRFTQRNALDLAFSSAAAKLEYEEDGRSLRSVKLALGAVGPTVIDASASADVLIGHPLDEHRLAVCADAASQLCEPISDHRASAGYRRQLIRTLIGDVVRQAAGRYGNKL